jgi:hypothetical protein
LFIFSYNKNVDDDDSIKNLKILNAIKKSLLYPSKCIFDKIKNAEIVFRKESDKLIDGRLTLKCLTSAFININSTNTLPSFIFLPLRQQQLLRLRKSL